MEKSEHQDNFRQFFMEIIFTNLKLEIANLRRQNVILLTLTCQIFCSSLTDSGNLKLLPRQNEECLSAGNTEMSAPSCLLSPLPQETYKPLNTTSKRVFNSLSKWQHANVPCKILPRARCLIPLTLNWSDDLLVPDLPSALLSICRSYSWNQGDYVSLSPYKVRWRNENRA